MKIKIVFTIIVLAVFFNATSCKRASIADPGTQGNPGVSIVLNGTANPSLLYIPDPYSQVTTQLTVTVTKNGVPYTGKGVVFEQILGSSIFNIGYFDNYDYKVEKTTNSAGVVSAIYTVPVSPYVIARAFPMYVRAWVVDDSHTTYFYNIPISLLPYDMGSTETTYSIQGRVYNTSNIGVSLVIMTLSAQGGAMQTSVELTDSDGGYVFRNIKSGWAGSITPKGAPSAVFSPTAYTYTAISSNYINQDFVVK
jgi:hypothetical protein